MADVTIRNGRLAALSPSEVAVDVDGTSSAKLAPVSPTRPSTQPQQTPPQERNLGSRTDDSPGGFLNLIKEDVTIASPKFSEFIACLRHFAGRHLSNEPHHDSVLGVVSPGRGEGRTTASLALARALAEIYPRVVLVEMEGLRGQPSLCAEMQIPFFGGLRSLLRGAGSLEDALWHTDTKNLWLLPFGASSYEINGLDATTRTREILASLRTMFDVVVVDMPPLLLDEKTPPIITHLSGLIFLVESGSTSVDDFSKSLSLCESVPIRGVLLNKTNLATPKWLASLLGS